jgi:anti-sigma regulatory factor (Ser/Thr protein kinase)
MDKGEDASLVTAAVMDGNEALMEHDRAVSQHDIDVIAGPGAAASARHAVAALGEFQVRQRIDAVQLATSELVTNAVRHGDLRHDVDPIHITVRIGDQSLSVTVEQPTAAADVGVAEGRLGSEDAGGFGLRLVDQLVDKWGYDPGPPGHVWFEFDEPSSTGPNQR